MPFVESERTAIADFERSRLTYVSLHTGDPTTLGDHEADAARVELVWNNAVNGVATADQALVAVPAGTYTHFGTWDAATGGNFRGGNPLSTVAVMSVAGQIKVTVSIPVAAV